VFTNNCQIGLPTESRRINPTNNLVVSSISDNVFLNFITNNKEESGNFSQIKIYKVNQMKDNFGNECYGCIYKITNLMNGKCYIGQTTKNDYFKYINDHFNNALCGEQYRKYFYCAIRKYGKKNFKIEILGFCYLRKELKEAEIESIWVFRSFGSDGDNFDKIYGYNLTKGGEGTNGYKWTEESRIRNSIAQTGKKRSKEEIEKRKNLIVTEKTKIKLSESGKKSHEQNPKRAKQQGVKVSGSLNGRYNKGYLTKGELNGKYIKIDENKLIELYNLQFNCNQIGKILNTSCIVPKDRLKDLNIIKKTGCHGTKKDNQQRENLINLFIKGEISYEQLIKQRHEFVNSNTLSFL